MMDDGQFIESWLLWGKGSVAKQLRGLRAGVTLELNVIPLIPALRSGVSRTITKAWFGVKSPETAVDATENAAWTLAGGLISISTTDVTGRGQILNNSEGSPELRFDLTAANTLGLTPYKTYHYAAQVKMSDGALYEVDVGVFDVGQQIVIATA